MSEPISVKWQLELDQCSLPNGGVGLVNFGQNVSHLKFENDGSVCGQFFISDTFSQCLVIDWQNKITNACINAGVGKLQTSNGNLQIRNIDDRPILEKLIFPDQSIANHAQIEARARKYRLQEKRRKKGIKKVSDHYQRTGVYLLYDDDYEVVYVGQSVRPLQRINQHLKSNKEFSYFKIIWCLDSKKLHWEKKLTQYYDPKFNKTNRPQKYV